MLRRIPLRLLNEWAEYFRQAGPSSEYRMDWRFGQLCALTAAAHGAENVTVEKYMWKSELQIAETEELRKARKLADMHAWKHQNSAEAKRRREAGKR